jgi:hypothetical protein
MGAFTLTFDFPFSCCVTDDSTDDKIRTRMLAKIQEDQWSRLEKMDYYFDKLNSNKDEEDEDEDEEEEEESEYEEYSIDIDVLSTDNHEQKKNETENETYYILQ